MKAPKYIQKPRALLRAFFSPPPPPASQPQPGWAEGLHRAPVSQPGELLSCQAATWRALDSHTPLWQL